MMVRYFAPTLTRPGVLTAHPAAFFVLACYVGAWLVFNPKSFDWQSVARHCSSNGRDIGTRRPFTRNSTSCCRVREEREVS